MEKHRITIFFNHGGESTVEYTGRLDTATTLARQMSTIDLAFSTRLAGVGDFRNGQPYDPFQK